MSDHIESLHFFLRHQGRAVPGRAVPTIIFGLFLLLALPASAMNPHPRLWHDAQKLSMMKAKACIGPNGAKLPRCTVDPDYVQLRTDIDSYINNPVLIWTWTVTDCRPGNPTVCTTAENMNAANGGKPWGGKKLSMGGLTGDWAALNTGLTRQGREATYVSPNSFSIAFDSSRFGSYAGQKMVNFWDDGQGGGANPTGRILDFGYVGSKWLYFARAVIDLYYITGDAKYRASGLKVLDYINSVSAAGMLIPIQPSIIGFPGKYGMNNDGCYGTRNVLPAVALLFDSFYDVLTPAQKSATIASGQLWYPYIATKTSSDACFETINGWGPENPKLDQNWSQGNYWGGHILGLGMLGYATWGDNPTDSGESNAWIKAARNSFDTEFAAAFKNMDGKNSGGATLESYNYGESHWARLFQYLSVIRNATGEDLLGPYAEVHTKNLAFNIMPGRWEATRMGTYPGDQCLGMHAGIPVLTMASFLFYSGHKTEAGYLRWMFDHFDASLTGKPGCYNDMFLRTINRNGSTSELERFELLDPNIKAIDYGTVYPKSYISTGDWTFYQRSDWTPNATEVFARLSAQKFQDHADKAYGNIEIRRGAHAVLVSHAQWGGGDWHGIGGQGASNGNDSVGNGFYNSLYFNDGGAYTQPGDGRQGSERYYGGAQTFAPYIRPKYLAAPEYMYGSNELTFAFEKREANPPARTMRYWFRSFVTFADAAVTIVQDLARTSNASYDTRIRWYLNQQNAPVVEGNLVSSVVEDSKIYVNAILPQNASLDISQATTRQFAASKLYHLDIKNGAPSTDLNVVSILYAGSSREKFPGAAVLQSDNRFTAVQVLQAEPKVIVMAKAVADKGGNRYELAAQHDSSFTSNHPGSGRYVVAGLAPGSYTVSLGGSVLKTLNAGTDGSITWTGNAGSYVVAAARPEQKR